MTEALRILLRDVLPATFETAFGRKPMTVNGWPDDAYVRFAIAAGEELGVELDAELVREQLMRSAYREAKRAKPLN